MSQKKPTEDKMARSRNEPTASPPLDITITALALPGELSLPAPGHGIVMFAHGSGSGRLSPRNRQVAADLRQAGFGTLLFDLLQTQEMTRRENVFDINLLSERLLLATEWLGDHADLNRVPVGYFGASTGAAAALVAAALAPQRVGAIVSRGGRPDLAGLALERVTAPTLLIVGGDDVDVLPLNQKALDQLTCTKRLEIVPHAGHLFEEPKALEAVTRHALAWFGAHLVTGD